MFSLIHGLLFSSSKTLIAGLLLSDGLTSKQHCGSTMTYFSTILNKNLWNHGLQKFVYQDKNCQHKILGHDVRRKKEYLHKAVPFI